MRPSFFHGLIVDMKCGFDSILMFGIGQTGTEVAGESTIDQS
jgi:hypothetical protein